MGSDRSDRSDQSDQSDRSDRTPYPPRARLPFTSRSPRPGPSPKRNSLPHSPPNALHRLTLLAYAASVPALMRKLALILTLSVLGSALTSPVQALTLYRSEQGWKIDGEPSAAIEPAAVEQMRKAEHLEAADSLSKSALNAYRDLVQRYPASPLAPKAQFKVGSLLERTGEYDKAYRAFETYLSKYPRGDDFEPAVESMFKIAKLFLEGQRKKVLGVPVTASMSRAVEMFEGIVKKAPFSKWAPLAQFNIGQAYEKQGKTAEATAAYQTVVTRYSNDGVADDALYQIGYVRFKEHREGSNDRGSAEKAREAFEEFINRYPASEKVAQARENLKSIDSGSNKGTLEIAKFYEKSANYKAAVIYYNDVIKFQPDTPESTVAKTRIADLKQRFGEDALRAGPERTETGARAQSRRRLQAKIDTVSRPDYVGPKVKVTEPDEVAPSSRPRLRTSPQNVVPMPPALEPPLPEALPQDPGLPKPPQ